MQDKGWVEIPDPCDVPPYGSPYNRGWRMATAIWAGFVLLGVGLTFWAIGALTILLYIQEVRGG